MIKCYDIVESITDEATRKFGHLFTENEDRKNMLAYYCSLIDDIIDVISGNSLEVEVDEIGMTISIAIGCEENSMSIDDDLLSNLSDLSLDVYTYLDEDRGDTMIKFVFPGIWEKTI